MRRALLLLVDGLRADVAESELAAGNLPNLAALTASGGRTRAVTAFPSTTSVAYLPFLTGCLPGRADVPSIRWLDRRRYRGRWWTERAAVRSYCGYQAGMLDGDISPDVTTIFELVPQSVAIFSMITRGLVEGADRIQGARKFWGTISHYTENHQPGDDAVAAELLRQVDAEWQFCFAQFPAVDGHTHAATPDAPRVLESLRKFDTVVGKVTTRLKERGILDETLIMLVSDHGAGVVDQHLDLATWFRKRGVRTLAHPVLWTRQPQVAVMVAGNAQAGIYVEPGSTRSRRLQWDELGADGALGLPGNGIETLLAEPGVALIAGEHESGVMVASADGEALLQKEQDGLISYRRLTGDPLQLEADLSLDPGEWLAHTIDGPWPDAPIALLDQFRSERTADLVLAAARGWDFRDSWEYPEHKSGHGSLLAEQMITPLWSNRPLHGRPWRTADVFPQLLEWLGLPVPEGIDGRS